MNLQSKSHTHLDKMFIIIYNQINARALIDLSAMVYCASKLMQKSRVLWIII